uniref:Uncharacterized protein n=1 Tax=Bionectria ochroleuca TaxID=29856 RepID=A0A8H7TUS5_BIOOC
MLGNLLEPASLLPIRASFTKLVDGHARGFRCCIGSAISSVSYIRGRVWICCLLGFRNAAPPHGSQLPPTPRAPLRELPMSPGGALIGCRIPTHRPLPSADKENQQALREALESQQQYYLFQLQQLARGIEQLQRQYRDTHRILRSSIRISQSQIIANDAPAMPQSRLSMPELSDDSGSEPDLSVLAMTRPGPLEWNGFICRHMISLMITCRRMTQAWWRMLTTWRVGTTQKSWKGLRGRRRRCRGRGRRRG